MTHFFIQNKSLLTSTFGHPRPFTYVGKHQHLATQEPLKKWMGRSQELHNFKIYSRGALGAYYTQGLGGG